MTCGVMGQKDWDEHLPEFKKSNTKEVVYTQTEQYASSIVIPKEWLNLQPT